MHAIRIVTISYLLMGMLLPSLSFAGHRKDKNTRSGKHNIKTVPTSSWGDRFDNSSGSEKVAAATAVTLAATAAAFGLKFLYQFLILSQAQYVFRNENTNTTTWCPVTVPERKICRKWEQRYPVPVLQQLYTELKAQSSYDLPKDLYSMVINWNNGIHTKPQADGFCYPFLSFIDELRTEEGVLANLYNDINSFFVWWRLQDFIAYMLSTEDFLQNIMTYRQRLKLLRQIIIASNEYRAEQAKFNERALTKLQLQALQGNNQAVLTMPIKSVNE